MIPVYLRIGAFSFGVGASESMIREIVERRGWMTLEDFSKSLSIAALLPGPFHVNFVALTGYQLGGYPGALLALCAFILPGFLLAVFAIQSLEFSRFRDFLQQHPGIVKGILAALAGLIMSAVVKLSKRTVDRKEYWLIVILISALLWYIKLPFAVAVAGGGFIFALMNFLRPGYVRS
jgi:chromate transporter